MREASKPTSVQENQRCDRPGCASRVTQMYLVGLGGMLAFYCEDHRPLGLPPYPKEAEEFGVNLRGESGF